MGVPALFRWLSRKYPKIVVPVVEEQPQLVPGSDGEAMAEVPVDITKPNPNGQEVDCLYLDMNGIVHPCTHPEGKPAPKTEAEMMMEVFKYTERVINMARPRKVLLMAIDGVAPRAKMNQQRSRRFRAAEEARVKAKEKEEAIAEWEAMGKVLSDEYKNAKAWDTNAITPGTPFMDLLAASLRYWVAYKMNTDPGWANLQVIISDASVPGEGEHKIMDFVRRQRSQPGYDANTTHVFYGLDADLIMLSLATHEPNFKILREDVFQQGAKRGCHKCGQPGHHSAKCLGLPAEKKVEQENDSKGSPLKPFIFLDVSVLREYLQIELNVPGLPFAFDQERAIDDWVFMIFFVGNDFLPHLPSLDIREGAIDMLLKIWRDSLPQMGGYLTDNGSVDLHAAQIIMDGLSSREDEIFRKRRVNDQRQDEIDKQKRRRIDEQNRNEDSAKHMLGDAHSMRNGVEYVPVIQPTAAGSASTNNAAAESVKPAFVPASTIAGGAPPASKGPPKPTNPMFISSRASGNAPIRGTFLPNGARNNNASPSASDANASGSLMATSQDVVANRAAIRKANLSAAEMLKAELAGKKMSPPAASPPLPAAAETAQEDSAMPAAAETATDSVPAANGDTEAVADQESAVTAVPSTEDAVNANSANGDAIVETEAPTMALEPDGTKDAVISTPAVVPESVEEDVPAQAVDGTGPAAAAVAEEVKEPESSPSKGKKRSADEAGIPANRSQAEQEDAQENGDGDDESDSSSSSDEEGAGDTTTMTAQKAHVPKPLKMLGNNMVEQEDTVQLWEPGYKQRYYEQKFNAGIEDRDFRREVAKHYVEGLAWVLAYYYKGCPSWTWYYPYHFAPFASDFTELESMNIDFQEGKPFRPFEQLMGVFPAASRIHLPQPFQELMTQPESEIIDFYPEEFHIDMNGKKMLWQGVALLPFIDESRLLGAMASKYPELTEDENRRNGFGKDVLFVHEDNPLYDQISSLYMKRKLDEPVPMDAALSRGVRGTILPNEDCVPNSTYISPLPSQPLSDLENDRSISAHWWMPEQLGAHRSVLLPTYRPLRRVLTPDDIEAVRRGDFGDGGGGRDRFRRGPAGDGFHSQRRAMEDNGPRRSARDVADARGRESRPSNNGYGGYGNSNGGGRYDGNDGRGSSQSYGSYGGGRGSDRNDPYGGYSSNGPPSGGGYGGYSNSGRSGYDDSRGGSRGGYGQPPSSNGYGAGYGGYGNAGPPAPAQSYGSYGSAPPPPPRGGGYDAPPSTSSSYGGRGGSYGSYGGGGYGSSSYGQPPPPAPAPYQHSYGSYGGYGGPPPAQPPSSYGGGGAGYNPPPPPQGGQQGYLPSYGGGYGGYGQAAPPPPQGGYRPPPAPGAGPPGYSNHSAILPPHLQQQQNQHQRWSR